MAVTVKQLSDVARKDLLLSGGVDNWDWYSDSLDLAGYVPLDDAYEDATAFLSALDAGGVDNWVWYGEALTGLSDYEDYLASLNDVSNAPGIFQWRDAIDVSGDVLPLVNEPVAEIVARQVKGATEGKLYALIVSLFGEDKAPEVFQSAIEAGIWKANTFPKEYRNALKVIQPGVENPLEAARGALFDSVVKNKKLDVFLSDVAVSLD